MLVCHCKRVHCRVVRDCVRAGARDPEAVAQRCGAGTGCGGCKPLLGKLVEREVAQNERSRTDAAA